MYNCKTMKRKTITSRSFSIEKVMGALLVVPVLTACISLFSQGDWMYKLFAVAIAFLSGWMIVMLLFPKKEKKPHLCRHLEGGESLFFLTADDKLKCASCGETLTPKNRATV